MKEATGELNMTLVTVIAISAVAAVFTLWVWPNVKANIKRNTYCSGAFNCKDCGSDGLMTCSYTDEETGETKRDDIKCPCDSDDSKTNKVGA